MKPLLIEGIVTILHNKIFIGNESLKAILDYHFRNESDEVKAEINMSNTEIIFENDDKEIKSKGLIYCRNFSGREYPSFLITDSWIETIKSNNIDILDLIKKSENKFIKLIIN